MLARPRRSVLYMPGSNAKALAKAATLPADALILDLEDSVAPDAKIAARGQVAEAVRARGFGGREVIIRVNGMHTPWGEDDLVAAIAAGPDAILLPKVDGPGAIMVAARALREGGAPERTPLMGDDGDPNAILNAGSIAAVAADPASRLAVLVMGLNDLAKETRARLTPGRSTMTAWLASCAVAARAHGVDIIDGVYNDIKDLEGFRLECVQGATWASTARRSSTRVKIDVCNEAFAPRRRRSKTPAPSSKRSRARERRQGRNSAQRPHGRAAARRHGPPHARHRGRDRRAEPSRGLIEASELGIRHRRRELRRHLTIWVISRPPRRPEGLAGGCELSGTTEYFAIRSAPYYLPLLLPSSPVWRRPTGHFAVALRPPAGWA